MRDPAAIPQVSEARVLADHYRDIKNAVAVLGNTSKMPPVAVDGWASVAAIAVTAEQVVARKVVVAPPFGIIQAEGYVNTSIDTVGEIFLRENFSNPVVDTEPATIPANSNGLVRFTWAHPFSVGWEAIPLELQWRARRVSGSGTVDVAQPHLLTFAGAGYLDGQTDGKPEFSGVTLPPPPPPPPPPAPPAPTTRVDTWGPTATSSWRPQSPEWGKAEVWQGQSSAGWGPYKGLAYYDGDGIRASLAGRTVTYAQVYVHRLAGIGVAAPQALLIHSHPHLSQPGGEPTMVGGEHIGSLGTNQAAWLPVPVGHIQSIQANTANGLGLFGGGYMFTINWTLQITSVG